MTRDEAVLQAINIPWRDAQISMLRDSLDATGLKNIRRVTTIL